MTNLYLSLFTSHILLRESFVAFKCHGVLQCANYHYWPTKASSTLNHNTHLYPDYYTVCIVFCTFIQTFEENSPTIVICKYEMLGWLTYTLICVLTTFYQIVMVKKPHAHGPTCSRWQIGDGATPQSCLFSLIFWRLQSVLNEVAEQNTCFSLIFSFSVHWSSIKQKKNTNAWHWRWKRISARECMHLQILCILLGEPWILLQR